MNVAVLNMKTIIKYLVLVCAIFLCVAGTRFFSTSKNKEKVSFNFGFIYTTKYIDEILPDVTGKSIKKENENDKKRLKNMLAYELPYIEAVVDRKVETNENDIQEAECNIELASVDVETKEIEENNIPFKYNEEYGNVKIKNETELEIKNEMLEENLEINNNDVIIFHTHTCESYTPSQEFEYEMTGTYRTTDLNFTVSRVGDKLEEQLKQYGFNVYHNKTYHDYPAYSGSYDRSMDTVKEILQNEFKSDIIIDLHRDAVGNGADYAPKVQIGEDIAAQLMFVIGTNGGGLEHNNWSENLKYAYRVQKKANEMYPGLFRPIVVRNSRYNQHLGKAAVIIEVGATGNTMEQCLVSMKYLAKVMSEM